MTLPRDFQFSQASLQDFVTCRRRFQLRYLQGLRWPAAPAQPIDEHERRMLLGTEFHRMVQRYLLGIPEPLISRAVDDPELQLWWKRFRDDDPVTRFVGDVALARVWAETTLLGEVGGYRLIAKYDVLAIKPGKQALILDWKTSSEAPSRRWLQERLQSRAYPYVLVQAGMHLNDAEPIAPRQVELVYWFPASLDRAVRLPYSALQRAEDADYLTDLVATIAELEDDAFYLTEDQRACRYCVYRSYCDRGEEAGFIAESGPELEFDESPLDLEIDLEQIAEIEF